MDKVRVIASTTCREAARQPVFYVVVASFAALVYVSRWTSLFGFGQEARVLREMAVCSVVFCGALLAIVLAGTVVTGEFERRTALTILSKPIERHHLLLGKFFGLLRVQLVAVLWLLAVLVLTIWHHDGAEGLEQAVRLAPADPCAPWRFLREFAANDVLPLAGAALLGFLEVAVLTAACVVVAFHAPMVVTGSVCLSLYLLGHLSGYIHDSLSTLGPLARGAGRVLYLVLPNLDAFNLSEYIAGGGTLTARYVGLSSLYASAYAALVLWIGTVSLARKEIP